jgi:hypothetical protein
MAPATTAAAASAATTAAPAATSGLGGADQYRTGEKNDCCDARARFHHDTISHVARPS